MTATVFLFAVPLRKRSEPPPLRKQRHDITHCSIAADTVLAKLNWAVKLSPSRTYKVLNESPPLLRLPSVLTASQCDAVISTQRLTGAPERANYLNFDSGDGHGFRQGIDPRCSAFEPILQILNELFPQRAPRFAEELWIRPRNDSIIIRDATTVQYYAGEGVGAHVDGKDATLLIYLQQPTSGGATVFENVRIACPPVQGDALLYESKHALTHYAEKVREGEKWVMQLLIDYRTRRDDLC